MGNTISTMLSSFTRISDVIRGIFSGENTTEENSFGPPDIMYVKRDLKSVDMARIHLDEGHRYLTSESTRNTPLFAVQKYTKSIMYAPVGSYELNRAYAARSVALFHSKLIADSLADNNRVCLDTYPNELKAQLFYGKALCYQILYPSYVNEIIEAFDEVKKWIPHMEKKDQVKMIKKMKDRQMAVLIDSEELIEQIDAEMIAPAWNPEYLTLLPGLSDDVDLKYERIHGRYLVAKKDLKEGETIAIQVHKPYVTIILLEKACQFCWNCGKKTWSSVPCYDCSKVVFCSDDCRETAWHEYHDIECQILHEISRLNTGNDLDDYCIYGSMKLTIRALKEAEYSFNSLKENLDKLYGGVYNANEDPALLDPEKYLRLFALTSYIDGSGDVKKYSKLFKKMGCLLASGTDLYERADAVNANETLQKTNKFIFLIYLLQINFIITKNNGIFFGKSSEKLHMIVPAITLFTEACENIIDEESGDNKIGIVTTNNIREGQKIQLMENCIAKFYRAQ